MWHELEVGRKLLDLLLGIDQRWAEELRAGGCPRCRGPLHAGHYERKPRGGRLACAAEEVAYRLRLSFCCGREGCRRRLTPPSVRFLGRKVYVEVAVLVAGALLPWIERQQRAIREVTGIAARTVRRWQQWWQTVFVGSALWVQARGRLPGLAAEQLPGDLLEAFAGGDAQEKLVAAMTFLSPLTTGSVAGPRCSREGG